MVQDKKQLCIFFPGLVRFMCPVIHNRKRQSYFHCYITVINLVYDINLKILAAMNSPFFPEINNLCLLPIKVLSITYKLISEANLVPNSGFIHIYTIEQVNKTRLLYFNIKMAFPHAEYECSSCYLYTVIMYYISMQVMRV